MYGRRVLRRVGCAFCRGKLEQILRPQKRSERDVWGRVHEGGELYAGLEGENVELRRLLRGVAAGDKGGAFTSLVGPRESYVWSALRDEVQLRGGNWQASVIDRCRLSVWE